MHLNKMRISTRLFILMGLMAVMLIGVGSLGLQGISRTNDAFKTAYEDRLVPLKQLTELKSLMQTNQLLLVSAMLTPVPEVVQKIPS